MKGMRPRWRMPGEFEPHRGTLLIWPVRPGSWPYGGRAAKQVFCRVMECILASEAVYLAVDAAHAAEAAAMAPPGTQLLTIESDDAWARDVGPTFVVDAAGALTGIDWQFNAWGGTVDGLYASWAKDDALAAEFCRQLHLPCYDARPFILEGGSIHVDGEGTILTTEACLLSGGRNATMDRTAIERRLCELLGGEKVLWLPRGIYQDETNEHVDNICAFVQPGEVVLAWTDNRSDPQYALSAACLEYLRQARDARGRRLRVHLLPLPERPVTVTSEELAGYAFADGEAARYCGERLAASYVNFYLTNGGVLVPQFGDAMDAEAVRLLGSLFPGRQVYPLMAREILLGGGNIHCITHQIPLGTV